MSGGGSAHSREKCKKNRWYLQSHVFPAPSSISCQLSSELRTVRHDTRTTMTIPTSNSTNSNYAASGVGIFGTLTVASRWSNTSSPIRARIVRSHPGHTCRFELEAIKDRMDEIPKDQRLHVEVHVTRPPGRRQETILKKAPVHRIEREDLAEVYPIPMTVDLQGECATWFVRVRAKREGDGDTGRIARHDLIAHSCRLACPCLLVLSDCHKVELMVCGVTEHGVSPTRL